MSENIVCSQCGRPAQPGQKFCESCGSQLGIVHKSSSNPSTLQNSENSPSSNNFSGLFDPRHRNYVIKEKFWDWGSGPIFDETGLQIGKMKRKLLTIREKIDIMEVDDRVVASIHRKLIAIRPTYILKDEHEQILGSFEKTLLSLLHPKFYLKDPLGRIVMTAEGKLLGFDFQIYRGKEIDPNNIVAEIHKADRWRDVFFSGGWDFSDTYGVKILQEDIDRRLVLGFVIAIDNVIHDN